jgi:hypothetical protein
MEITIARSLMLNRSSRGFSKTEKMTLVPDAELFK